jgi:hypothetical protein
MNFIKKKEKMEKSKRRLVFFVGFLVVMGWFLFTYYFSSDGDSQFNQLEFDGYVKMVEINDKGFPIVVIRDKIYTLDFIHRFGQDKMNVVVGDSLVKKANTNSVLHYRNDKLLRKYKM